MFASLYCAPGMMFDIGQQSVLFVVSCQGFLLSTPSLLSCRAGRIVSEKKFEPQNIQKNEEEETKNSCSGQIIQSRVIALLIVRLLRLQDVAMLWPQKPQWPDEYYTAGATAIKYV